MSRRLAAPTKAQYDTRADQIRSERGGHAKGRTCGDGGVDILLIVGEVDAIEQREDLGDQGRQHFGVLLLHRRNLRGGGGWRKRNADRDEEKEKRKQPVVRRAGSRGRAGM